MDIFPNIIVDKFSVTKGIVDDSMFTGENSGNKEVSYFTDKNVKFYDYNFGLSGYINWIIETRKIQKVYNGNSSNNNTITNEYIYAYPIITVTGNDGNKIKNGKEYLDKLIELYNSKLKEDGELYYTKSFKRQKYYLDEKYEGEAYVKQSGFLSKNSDSYEDLEKRYINSFFSNAKNIVWKKVKKIHFDPEFFFNISQQPRAGYVFYGPPGTGKSSFVTRLAIVLKRHLINLDLRDFIDKSSIYREILTPSISGLSNQKQKDVIFILDEFDLLIDELCEQEERKETVIVNKETKLKMSIKEQTKFLRDFTIHDLVELFQGSIPCNGLIIIAITNDFERIYKKCPKLFRDGRLTPVKFDYMDLNVLNELCVHYFGQSSNLKFEGILNVAPSTVIDKAVNCGLYSDDKKLNLGMFEEEINRLINSEKIDN